MSCLENAAYSIKVIVKKQAYGEDNTKPITEKDWKNYQSNPQITTFIRNYSQDLKVYELKRGLCEGGFVPNAESMYNKTVLYVADGFGEKLKKINKGNSNSELFEIFNFGRDPILLVLINDYDRKQNDAESDEPYLGWHIC